MEEQLLQENTDVTQSQASLYATPGAAGGETVVEHSEAQEQAQQATPQSENFRNLRQAKERAEQRAIAAEQRARDLEARFKQPEPEYAQDDLVPRDYVDRKLESQKREIQQLSTEYKLKTNYPDFDKVVNADTIELLKEKNPTMALALSQVPDEYSKAAAAYEAIRNLGLYNDDIYAKDRELAQQRANSPRPLASISPQKNDSPLAQANAFAQGLTDDVKKELWKEMNQYRNNSWGS